MGSNKVEDYRPSEESYQQGVMDKKREKQKFGAMENMCMRVDFQKIIGEKKEKYDNSCILYEYIIKQYISSYNYILSTVLYITL